MQAPWPGLQLAAGFSSLSGLQFTAPAQCPQDVEPLNALTPPLREFSRRKSVLLLMTLSGGARPGPVQGCQHES